MKKKTLALALVTGLLVGCLTGCGQETPKESSTQKESEVSASTKESEEVKEENQEEPETVTVCFKFPESEDQDMVFDEVNKLLRERYNLEIDPIFIEPGEYATRIKLMITSKEEFDLCYADNWSNPISDNVAMGAFLELNDLLKTESAELLMSVFPEELLADTTIGGKIYAIPNYQAMFNQIAAFVQKDLADEYGLELEHINSIRELEPFMEWVRDNKEDIWPVCESDLAYLQYYAGADFSYAGLDSDFAGTDLFNGRASVYRDDENFQVIDFLDNPYWIESLRLGNEYYKKGFVRSDVATVVDNSADKIAGKYAIIKGSANPAGAANTSAQYGEEYIQITCGDLVKNVGIAASTVTAISANSKNPEAAIKLLGAIWTDKEIYNMILFGLEDVHYTKVDENRVEPFEGSKYNNGVNAWRFGSQFNAYLMPGQQDGLYEEVLAWNEAAPSSHLSGFSNDLSSVETENAQLNAVQNEYLNQYLYVEDFDSYIAEWKQKLDEAGIDKFVEVTQQNIDTWRKENGK